MTPEERAARRKEKLVVAKSQSFAEAEDWDLEFWLSRTPQERLEALIAIREDVEKVISSRERNRNSIRKSEKEQT